jgi:uncharacterized protein
VSAGVLGLSELDWKYVNLRRRLPLVEESLDTGAQWVVFEPNDEPMFQ